LNKKVLYISYDGMTDQLGQSQVLPYLVGLSSMGYQFTLLSFEKKHRFEQSAKLIEEICKKNNIKWVPEFFSHRPPLLSKIYDNYKMKRKVRKLHQEENFAFTHCRSYVAASASLSLYKKRKVPFLFDMRGFWVDERVDNGQWNLGNPVYKWAYKFFKKKEKQYLSQSAHIISLTENGKTELIENYEVPGDKITVIPCCADLFHFDYNRVKEDEKKELRQQLGIGSEQKILSYLGSLGGWYLVAEMLDFFKVLKRTISDAKFLFITQDNKDRIIEIAKSRGMNEQDIVIHAASRKEIPALLSLGDWSIFFIKDAYSKKASSPTKQGEIMAMGVPVICNDIGDTGRIVNKYRVGVVVNTFTNGEYQKAIEQITSDIDISKSSIREGALDFFDLQTGVEKYLNIYRNKINDKKK